MDKNDEPRASTALWATVILLIVVGFLIYWLGKATGVSEGIEKGTKNAQLEQISEELKQLKQETSAEERQRRNLKLAQELTSNSNTENK